MNTGSACFVPISKSDILLNEKPGHRPYEQSAMNPRSNLAQYLASASAKQWASGVAWYANARAFALRLAWRYSVPFETVCGVISALSPGVYWELNQTQAESLIRGDENPSLSTYGRQVEKARRILSARLTDVLAIRKILGRRAFKTWAFFDNIRNPESSEVTIDQHIIDAAGLTTVWTKSARNCYYRLAAIIRQLAAHYCLRPYEAQAIIWTVHADLSTKKRPEPAPF